MQRPFSPGELEAVCKVLGHTETGLSGSDIGHCLQQIKVNDPDPTLTKWKRIYNALAIRQNEDNAGNKILAFISFAMEPARHICGSEAYRQKLLELNKVLSLRGMEFREDGNFHIVARAKTLSEAEQRASRLKEKLELRGVHSELLRYCSAEIISDNYFHAVLEACKGIASVIRLRTDLIYDGAELIDAAFGGSAPRLHINRFVTKTETDEQKGFVNLAKGLFGTFRNPVAHAAKIEWDMTEADALDLFSLASYVLRRIDKSW